MELKLLNITSSKETLEDEQKERLYDSGLGQGTVYILKVNVSLNENEFLNRKNMKEYYGFDIYYEGTNIVDTITDGSGNPIITVSDYVFEVYFDDKTNDFTIDDAEELLSVAEDMLRDSFIISDKIFVTISNDWYNKTFIFLDKCSEFEDLMYELDPCNKFHELDKAILLGFFYSNVKSGECFTARIPDEILLSRDEEFKVEIE